MYEYESRVRLSEADQNQRMTLNAVLNHFQDCSIFQSEDLGVGLDFLEKKKRMWVLSSWKIVLNRYPKLGERIRVGTWPYEFDRMTGRRNFCLKDEQGQTAAYADSRWVYMNAERMRPALLDEDVRSAYALEPGLEMGEETAHILVPEETEAQEPFLVHAWHLDVNHHVNNGQYVQMAAGYLPENFEIHQMRAEYRKSAVQNDVIHPKVGNAGDVWTIALEDASGKPYAVIEFK